MPPKRENACQSARERPCVLRYVIYLELLSPYGRSLRYGLTAPQPLHFASGV